MKINWKVRLRNRVWLTALLAAAASFIFDLLTLLDVPVPVTESAVTDCIGAVLTLLTGLGVVIDPTTEGVCDSDRAMTYE